MKLPNIGDNIPRQGTFLSQAFGKIILYLGGWRFEGHPPNIAKALIVAAPHTSNWDAIYGIAAIFAMRMRLNWMAKHTVFENMFGRLLKKMGGVPIDRTSKHGVVEQTRQEFDRHEKFFLAITPEGTRKRVEKWKTGFYYIAKEANVPIVLGFLDYSKRELGFGPVIDITGDIDSDFKKMEDFFKNITGKHPHKFNPILRTSERV